MLPALDMYVPLSDPVELNATVTPLEHTSPLTKLSAEVVGLEAATGPRPRAHGALWLTTLTTPVIPAALVGTPAWPRTAKDRGVLAANLPDSPVPARVSNTEASGSAT